ncbi:DinB family protein [Flavobacterium sp. PL02]|uniref:DinB family protein n=1 Tax=Flavobacterium sp. PL02 TaxID=3088354 RepID=UPI002B2274CE|nr:DinB family protein [Flavobacterium sp. PL02]MEA9415410.1 DinB family protein [Flavobacterium sp. PL02]
MKTLLQKKITETFEQLYKILSSLSETELNTVPYEGSWTAGQVLQHLILASSGYPEMCSGPTEKTTREPDEKVKDIAALFLNFTIKMQAPEFIIPLDKKYNKNSLTLSLQKIEEELLHVSETYDLTLICLNSEIPTFGKFTIYEWINFSLIHIERHIKQLNTICQEVTRQ